MVVTMNVICGLWTSHKEEVKGNDTARLKMRMLVVLLMVLSKMTTRTTKRFPMNPMMITRVKITGTWNILILKITNVRALTTIGTTAIRVFKCFIRASSSIVTSVTSVELFIFSTTQIWKFEIWNYLQVTSESKSNLNLSAAWKEYIVNRCQSYNNFMQSIKTF